MPDTKLTNTDHERERRAFWDACLAAANHRFCDVNGNTDAAGIAEFAAELATAKLAERDKMFPGPVDGTGLSIDGEPGPDDPALCNACVSRDSTARTEPCLGCCEEYVMTGRRKNWRPR